jgi:hypothetical protein
MDKSLLNKVDDAVLIPISGLLLAVTNKLLLGRWWRHCNVSLKIVHAFSSTRVTYAFHEANAFQAE